jgi:4-hydroxy-tetrahydrodipicolinate reductase
MTRVCIAGAAGKMGQMVVAACAEAGLEVVAELEAGGDAGRAVAGADVVIDFTSPAGTIAVVEAAGASSVAVITGTTGLGAAELAMLERASQRIALLSAPNFSLGVNVMLGLAEQAARALGPAFDLEIVETHHRAKKDAPSGTALALGEALARGRGLALDKARVSTRDGQVGARRPDEIGIMALRGGDVAGEHTAFFFGSDERLELTHRAGSRMIFARGAVRAAQWIAGKPAGRYTMRQVLGLG